MNKKIVFLVVMGCAMENTDIKAFSWKNIFEIKQNDFSYAVNNVLCMQHRSYSNGTLPKIADIRIKNIPIEESGEDLVDIRLLGNQRIEMLANPENSHAYGSSELRNYNAGYACSSLIRADLFHALERMVVSLDLIAPSFGYKQGALVIKVFEGLRDFKVQEKIFNEKVEQIHKNNPEMTDQELFNEASTWVSPVKDNIPVHTTGAAIDIRLYDLSTQQFVDMGDFGVLFGKNECAPTFSENITDFQKYNRLMMLIAASNAGMINYPYEWWHYSLHDRYAEYWYQQAELPEMMGKALYGIKTL